MARIFSITEAASIALHGMVLIARSDKLLNVTQIADATGSSRHHVAKVLQRLVKDDILDSHRGPHGGFMLKKAPDEITLLNIYESIEGAIEVKSCPVEHAVCPFGECIMGGIAQKMTSEFKKYLNESKLESYL